METFALEVTAGEIWLVLSWRLDLRFGVSKEKPWQTEFGVATESAGELETLALGVTAGEIWLVLSK